MNAKLLELIDECEDLIRLAKKNKDEIMLARITGRKQGLVEALSIYRMEKKNAD